MNNQELDIELKRLLTLSEIAQSKVLMCNNRCENPRQQGASARLYRKAFYFAKANDLDILTIHENLIHTKIVTIEKWILDNREIVYWIIDIDGNQIDGFRKKYQAINAIERWRLIRIDKKVIVRNN